MKFLISGGTGLIGSKLTSNLIDNGHTVNIMSRRYRKSNNSRIEYFIWKPSERVIDKSSIKGVDVVINLAGSSIFSFWTKNNKKKILNSRIDSLSTLYQIIKREKNHNVSQVISASAIGIYPNSKTLEYDESFQSKEGLFLTNVVREWEKKIKEFNKLNIRVTTLRIGLVLSKEGGILKKLIQINKLRISNVIDAGDQCQSWIHIDDLVNIFYHVIQNKLEGTYNAVSPNPSTFLELQELASKLSYKPLLNFSIPKSLLIVPFKLIGILDFYYDVIASDKNVSASKIVNSGYHFNYPSMEKIK